MYYFRTKHCIRNIVLILIVIILIGPGHLVWNSMKDFFVTVLAAMAVYIIADVIISVVAFALHPAGQSRGRSVGCAISRNHGRVDHDDDDDNDNSNNP